MSTDIILDCTFEFETYEIISTNNGSGNNGFSPDISDLMSSAGGQQRQAEEESPKMVVLKKILRVGSL